MRRPFRAVSFDVFPPGNGIAIRQNQVVVPVPAHVRDPDRQIALGAGDKMRRPNRAVAVVAIRPNLAVDFHDGVERAVAVDVSQADPGNLAICHGDCMRSEGWRCCPVIFIPNNLMLRDHFRDPIDILKNRLTRGGKDIEMPVAVDVSDGRGNVRAAQPSCDGIHGNEKYRGKQIAILQSLDFQPKPSLPALTRLQGSIFSSPPVY